MIELENQTSFEINLDLCEKILKNETAKDIELIICENKYIQELNNEHRSKDEATDVLSFPLEFDFPNMPLGSIIISIDFVKEKASFYKHSNDDEFTLLFIHGLLHLLGYDHEIDEGQHRLKEEELILKHKLPNSLIIRNQ